MEKIINKIQEFQGNASFYYKNLVTGETAAYNADFSHSAASIIKIPIMVEAFGRFNDGRAKKDDLLTLKDEMRVPPCGVLTFMHQGLQVSLMDLIWLMITISDNVATNMLIDHLGVDAIEKRCQDLGLQGTHLARKLFDSSPNARGKTNLISAADMAVLLEQIYLGRLISKEASQDMLNVLLGQQLNNKIPFMMPLDYKVAHKTGEDGGTTHDVGIVYAKEPFIVCFCGSKLQDVPGFNRFMGETTLTLTQHCGGILKENY